MNEIAGTIAVGLLAIFLLVTGWKKGFFTLPAVDWIVPIRFLHLIGAFAIYFLVSFIATSLVLGFFKSQILSNYAAFTSWFNWGVSTLIFCFLALYLRLLPRPVRRGILLRSSEQGRPRREDVFAAVCAWVLAFPLVLFISQILEMVIKHLFGADQLPDQTAVLFLKSTFSNPTHFVLAILSIVILAPLIEETLFRGFLQSYIRQHLGSKQAILITSVCFSLFHYSHGQGIGNLTIIPSLFILALFLGFLYEKQGSILASMTLHASFNAISVINLYFFGGLSTGL